MVFMAGFCRIKFTYSDNTPSLLPPLGRKVIQDERWRFPIVWERDLATARTIGTG